MLVFGATQQQLGSCHFHPHDKKNAKQNKGKKSSKIHQEIGIIGQTAAWKTGGTDRWAQRSAVPESRKPRTGASMGRNTLSHKWWVAGGSEWTSLRGTNSDGLPTLVWFFTSRSPTRVLQGKQEKNPFILLAGEREKEPFWKTDSAKFYRGNECWKSSGWGTWQREWPVRMPWAHTLRAKERRLVFILWTSCILYTQNW